MSDILEKLQPVFKSGFRKELTIDDTPETVSTWDSAGHVMLCMEIEQAFGVTLTLNEMPELRSVKKICERLK